MNNNLLGLYDHNLDSYKKVRRAYADGEKIVGIVHATGTGKTLNALQLALDNKDKRILYLTPYNSIIEHIKEVIDENQNVDLVKDFGHVTFMTYSSLVNMSQDELEKLDVDLLILDEFHHIGAPVWGDRINTILETHLDLLVFGMSAYSVRDRGTAYERDLAEPNSDELFSDKIVSFYDLVDAMLDGVLPVPVYRGVHLQLANMVDKLDNRISSKVVKNDEFEEMMHVLHDVKRRISSSDDVLDLLLKNIKQDGKYIYFCPAVSKIGVNDVYSILDETKKYFLANGYREEDLCFYVSTSEEIDSGKTSRECFYNDVDLNGNNVDSKLRIMFAINQYNEGVHAPNIDGVILGRETSSDIVFYEQIGRALSVRGDTYEKIREYQSLSMDEVKKLCKEKDIAINNKMSKDDVIERLVAPVIIDLVGNYSFIKDLITELKHRIKLYKGFSSNVARNIEITENSFDVEFKEHDLFETLVSLFNRFTPKSWDEAYQLAVNYYEKHNNLEVSRNFKTDDGVNFEQYGFALGEWIVGQRKFYAKNQLDEGKIEKLNKIGMVWSYRRTFEEAYEMASNYYKRYGNLRIPHNFKTNDGVNACEDGYSLGTWLIQQRRKKKLGHLGINKIRMLEDIDIEWSVLKTWEESYMLAVLFHKKFGNLDMKKSYVTDDGYPLGAWVYNQRLRYKEGNLSKREISLLNVLKMSWETKQTKKCITWDESFDLLVNYYNEYGDTKVKREFKTFDGVCHDDEGHNLGLWVSRQRAMFRNGKLPSDRIDKLNSINFNWNEELTIRSWEDAYKLAVAYYVANRSLNIRTDFKTYDGVNYDETGYNLGSWIYVQRRRYNREELEVEKQELLNKIGMIWDVNKNYASIKQLLREVNLSPRRYSTKVKHLSYMEFEAKVRYLIANGLPLVVNGELNEIFFMAEANIVSKYGVSREDLIRNYSSIEKRI